MKYLIGPTFANRRYSKRTESVIVCYITRNRKTIKEYYTFPRTVLGNPVIEIDTGGNIGSKP